MTGTVPCHQGFGLQLSTSGIKICFSNNIERGMDIERIKSLIVKSSTTIQSAGSFSDKVDVVYDILDKAFPKTSAVSAVYGSITSLTDFMSRTEIEPLLEALKNSSKTGHEYVTTDDELNIILKAIYKIVKA